MDPDHDSVRSFAQRVGGDRRESGVECVCRISGLDQTLRQRLERMKPELVKALPLDRQPIVVPIGEELIGQPGRFELDAAEILTCEHTVRVCPNLVEVDTNVRAESK